MTDLCIFVALILAACLFTISFWFLAITSLCAALERDRRNGYQVRPYHNVRRCPQYLRRAAS